MLMADRADAYGEPVGATVVTTPETNGSAAIKTRTLRAMDTFLLIGVFSMIPRVERP